MRRNGEKRNNLDDDRFVFKTKSLIFVTISIKVKLLLKILFETFFSSKKIDSIYRYSLNINLT